MVLNLTLGALACSSLALLVWQWWVARCFPLHQRSPAPAFAPGLTLLKPLKGADAETEHCLRSWFTQRYPGPLQILFGVARADDPACEIVQRLMLEFPAAKAELLVCGRLTGANAKVAKLVEMSARAAHEVLIISDADVLVPPGFLSDVVAPLEDPGVGLVNCFYRLANPSTLAMAWEAIAVNADFWSQVLQARSLKPLDFALGAVMATRRAQLAEIGGFGALVNCLADDYQLGHRIARRGHRVELAPTVVECWSGPMTWAEVWQHQLRWARTIRVCQPGPYFLSILSNPTFWPLLWLALAPGPWPLGCAVGAWLLRALSAMDLQARLARQHASLMTLWLAPVKDVLQVGIWLLSFAGNEVRWRGERMRLRPDGTMIRVAR